MMLPCVTTDGGEAIINKDGTFNVGGGGQVYLLHMWTLSSQ